MSAIWGAIDFSGKEIDERVKAVFREGFSKCAIDRTEEVSDKEVYFGCGIQYITKESEQEKLPCTYSGKYFNADVILDNRGELCERLGIKNEESIPDGEILKRFFDKFGKDGLNTLLGAYAFVEYNREKQSVEIVADAVGNRFVYYIIEDGILYFSSLIMPIKRLMKSPKLCMYWVGDFLGIDGYPMFSDSETTQIEGVKRTAPAGHIVIEKGEIITRELYWDQENIKRTKQAKSDEEYREEFRTLYKRCVSDVLRANGETGILLSGGYDSTSVACLAAPILKERGKKLFSFTAVPLKEFKYDGRRNKCPDETEAVKEEAAFLGNVECEFMNLSDINLWDVRKKYRDILEMPYKSPQNSFWIYEGTRKLGEKGGRILLSGSVGNGTVSFDNTYRYMIQLISRFKFREFWSETCAIQKRLGGSRKRTIEVCAEGFIKSLNPFVKYKDEYKRGYASEAFLKKCGAISRFRAEDRVMFRSYYNPEKYHKIFLLNKMLRLNGEFAQKNSLYTGVVLRDPTGDKRMMEFVKTIPQTQFFHDGYNRRLIREYMEDIMPPTFFSRRVTGLQSADMKYRFELDGKRIMGEWKNVVESLQTSDIIDVKRLKTFLDSNEIKDMEYFAVARVFYTISLIEYMRDF